MGVEQRMDFWRWRFLGVSAPGGSAAPQLEVFGPGRHLQLHVRSLGCGAETLVAAAAEQRGRVELGAESNAFNQPQVGEELQ